MLKLSHLAVKATVGALFMGGCFLMNTPVRAGDDCLNLQTIGEEASKIENLEVRIDIVDIQGLETGRFSLRSAASRLDDAQSDEINNFFFSFKNDPDHKRFPAQGGCLPGAVVRIPESSHYNYYRIVEATSQKLVLRDTRDNSSLVIQRVGAQELHMVAEFLATEYSPVCNPDTKSNSLRYEAYINWGKKGAVHPVAPSEHLLELIVKYGESSSETECMQ